MSGHVASMADHFPGIISKITALTGTIRKLEEKNSKLEKAVRGAVKLQRLIRSRHTWSMPDFNPNSQYEASASASGIHFKFKLRRDVTGNFADHHNFEITLSDCFTRYRYELELS